MVESISNHKNKMKVLNWIAVILVITGGGNPCAAARKRYYYHIALKSESGAGHSAPFFISNT